MKQLTQEVFKGAPEWVKSFAVDSDGSAWYYGCFKSDLRLLSNCWMYTRGLFSIERAYGDFDATDWRNSAIDREVK